MAILSGSSKVYAVLAGFLCVATFGLGWIVTIVAVVVCFLAGLSFTLYRHGLAKSSDVLADLDDVARYHRFSRGNAGFLAAHKRFNDRSMYEPAHSMTGSAILDPICEQILGYVMRDFVDGWYSTITNDQLFGESVKRTTRRTVVALSQCLKKVDWTPLLTRHLVDDFASHLRLYRKAKEKQSARLAKTDANDPSKRLSPEELDEQLVSDFFDLELEMEKSYCRDLVSTMPQYENAYLHDLVDILLYLLMPMEDFRSRPFRFLVREIFVRRIILPVLDLWATPDFMNHMLVWLLSEQLNTDDYITTLETSNDVQELEAVMECLVEEIATLRERDNDGARASDVKQQLSSLEYVCNLVKRRMHRLTCAADGTRRDTVELPGADIAIDLIQLPIYLILTNTVAVSYFIDFLSTVGGSNYIDCYLAIEGFKVSVEHQLRGLSRGENAPREVYDTIKEAAWFMYQQYLSQEAITRVPLDDAIVNKFLSRLRNDEPSDSWFETIQEKVVDILKRDDRFYPAFKRDPLYVKMLAELGIAGGDAREQSPPSSDVTTNETASVSSSGNYDAIGNSALVTAENVKAHAASPSSGEARMCVEIATLGVGQQGSQSFAVYNVRVTKLDIRGQQLSAWNVLRRYSDFHMLNSVIHDRYPKLSNLSFPGKKTFNNLSSHFLEKRTKALNSYMKYLLQPNVMNSNPGLETVVYNFLSQKEYTGEREALSKKVVNALFDPFRNGVRAVGSAVIAVPDTVFDGVTRVGDGINKAAKQMLGNNSGNSSGRSISSMDSARVGACISDQASSESIPMRILILFVDEVFGVRARNQWFRRRLVALLRQLVHVTLGSSINRRVIDLVQFLTAEKQVAQYLLAFKDSLWTKEGVLREARTPRARALQLRTRVMSRALMLSAMPDELRLFIGAETSNSGIRLISEALQNERLNRRFLYVVLERLLVTIFPDNHFDRILRKMHAKSPRVLDEQMSK